MADDGVIQFVPVQPITSPCVLVCTLDPVTGWCLGCGRTGDEIARWTSVSEDERQAVMAALPARMATLEARG